MIWKQWLLRMKKIGQIDPELEQKERLYLEVKKAQREWERAYCAMQAAVGQDEVDIAIYTLEAAERRYQVQLKAAKQANVTWVPFQFGSYSCPDSNLRD
ncbi:DUF2508 family protein [Paenibacillus ihumii]|uniref:DUF2508 family protein n=1 Tax=Paenibacillus ihumii TaxID=687436 RepID=UPI0009FABC2E|nr:DUF2508 family protein [Paenibacillus ihumii]